MKSAFPLIVLFASLAFLVLIPTFIRPASGQYSISLQTDNTKYVVGTPIRASVQAFDPSTGTLNQPIPVILTLRQLTEAYQYPFDRYLYPTVIYGDRDISTVSTLVGNGTTSVLIASPTSPGDYVLFARVPFVSYDGSIQQPVTEIEIQIQELFATRTFEILFIGLGIGFVGLAIVIVKAPRSTSEGTSGGQGFKNLRATKRAHLLTLSFCFSKYYSRYFDDRICINRCADCVYFIIGSNHKIWKWN